MTGRDHDDVAPVSTADLRSDRQQIGRHRIHHVRDALRSEEIAVVRLDVAHHHRARAPMPSHAAARLPMAPPPSTATESPARTSEVDRHATATGSIIAPSSYPIP